MDASPTREACARLDPAGPLAHFRDEFVLPDGVVYLDGNSLGPLPRAVRSRVAEMVDTEWGQGLARSWNDAGWFGKPETVGDRLVPLLGADTGEVVVCDSTSVNPFKVFTAALGMRPRRGVVVAEAGSFPTDLYIMEGATELLGGYERHLLDDSHDLEEVLDEDVAVVVLNHVDYRTGAFDAVHELRDILDTGAWRAARHAQRPTVT